MTHRFSKHKNPTPSDFKNSKMHHNLSLMFPSPPYSKAHLSFHLKKKTLIFNPNPKNLLKLLPSLASGCKVANCPKTSVFLSAIACFACSGAKSTCAMAFKDPGLGDSTKLQLATTKIGVEKVGSKRICLVLLLREDSNEILESTHFESLKLMYQFLGFLNMKGQRLNWKLIKNIGKKLCFATLCDQSRKTTASAMPISSKRRLQPKFQDSEADPKKLSGKKLLVSLRKKLLGNTKLTQTNCEHPPPLWSLLARISNLNHGLFCPFGFQNSETNKNLID